MQWGRRFYMKSAFLPELNDEVVDLMVEHVSRVPSGGDGGYSTWVCGGAIADVAEDAMAFTGREAAFWTAAEIVWDDPDLDEQCRRWSREAMEGISRFALAGRYVNDVADAHEPARGLWRGQARTARRAQARLGSGQHVPGSTRTCDPRQMETSSPILVVDVSDVRTGKLAEAKVAFEHLAAFVEANEPDPLAYNVYFAPDGRQVTVVQLHSSSASLELHMDVAGPEFAKFADLLTLVRVELYGDPSAGALERMHRKAELLGNAPVAVHALHAGFLRFQSRPTVAT
jgi:hypothetical protein